MAAQSKTWKVFLEKVSPYEEKEDTLKNHLARFARIVEKNEQRRFKAKVPKGIGPPEIEESNDGKLYRYVSKLEIHKERIHNPISTERDFDLTFEQVQRAAQDSGWIALHPSTMNGDSDGSELVRPKDIQIRQNLDIKIPELTDDVYKMYFPRIFERDQQIRIIQHSSMTAADTGFDKRRHVLLYGKPACAKSEVLNCFKQWYNSTAEVVMELDSTTTTKAGLETQLLNKAKGGDLPPILLLEEIEKNDPKSLLCLLGVMDGRGRIQRTNARDGNNSAPAKILIWATCNDMSKLEHFEGGALLSRFSHKLYCSRPGKDLMKKILERECHEMNADPSCIDRVVEFGLLKLKTSDPRTFISLLDGWRDIDAYLKDYSDLIDLQESENKSEVEIGKYLDQNQLIDALDRMEQKHAG